MDEANSVTAQKIDRPRPLPETLETIRAFNLLQGCRQMSHGIAFGFDWEKVECVLERWHGLEIGPRLFSQLRICESEMLAIDLEDRRRREKIQKSRAGR